MRHRSQKVGLRLAGRLRLLPRLPELVFPQAALPHLPHFPAEHFHQRPRLHQRRIFSRFDTMPSREPQRISPLQKSETSHRSQTRIGLRSRRRVFPRWRSSTHLAHEYSRAKRLLSAHSQRFAGPSHPEANARSPECRYRLPANRSRLISAPDIQQALWRQTRPGHSRWDSRLNS